MDEAQIVKRAGCPHPSPACGRVPTKAELLPPHPSGRGGSSGMRRKRIRASPAAPRSPPSASTPALERGVWTHGERTVSSQLSTNHLSGVVKRSLHSARRAQLVNLENIAKKLLPRLHQRDPHAAHHIDAHIVAEALFEANRAADSTFAARLKGVRNLTDWDRMLEQLPTNATPDHEAHDATECEDESSGKPPFPEQWKFLHCTKCLGTVPADESPETWARLNLAFTGNGFVLWCVRHDESVYEYNEGDEWPQGPCRSCSDSQHTLH